MTPTADNREELRELIGEEIPAGGQDTDTLFTANQLDRLLKNATGIFEAAAEGWRKKAGKLQQKLGEIEQYSVGDENYKRINLTTAVNAALKMAAEYDLKDEKVAGKATGAIIKIKRPEVL